MKNEKEMAMIEGKMADHFFSKQEDEKKMVSKLFKDNNL